MNRVKGEISPISEVGGLEGRGCRVNTGEKTSLSQHDTLLPCWEEGKDDFCILNDLFQLKAVSD